MLAENAFLPILLTLSSYEVGRAIQRKTGNSLCNPILIGAILTASMLLPYTAIVLAEKKR